MRNPDLISKGKKVKGQGIEQILIIISSLSLSLSLSPFPPQERFSDDTSITTSSTSKSSSVSPRKIPRSTAELANNKYSFPGNYGRFSCSTYTCTLIPCVYGFIFEGFGVRVGKPRGPRQPPPHWNIVNGIIH